MHTGLPGFEIFIDSNSAMNNPSLNDYYKQGFMVAKNDWHQKKQRELKDKMTELLNTLESLNYKGNWLYYQGFFDGLSLLLKESQYL